MRHLPGLVGEEGDLQGEPGRFRRELAADAAEEDPPGLVALGSTERRQQQRVDRKSEGENHEGGPRESWARQQRPAGDEERRRRRRDETAAEIVENLEARDERQLIALDAASAVAHEREEPTQDLPVAAHPAMLPPGMGQDARRIVVHQLDIGDQRRAGVDPLEQVVREQRVLGHPPLERRAEGVDVIEPLAGEDPLAEEILIGVRHRRGVGVDAGMAGVETRKERTGGARHGHADPRLQDAVAFGHAAEVRVDARPVQGMRDDADEGARRLARQAGVGVQGDAVPHAGQQIQLSHHEVEARVGRAAQQAIELLELAAFALPAHERTFARIPQPGAVQEEEPPAGGRRMTGVERFDPRGRRSDDRRVARHLRLRRIGEVAQDREVNVGVGIAEGEHFEVLDHLFDAGHVLEQRWHDDERARRRRNARGGVETRQAARRHQPRDQALCESDRQFTRRQQQEERRRQGELRAGAVAPGVDDSERYQTAGEQHDRGEVEPGRMRESVAAGPQTQARPVGDVELEADAAAPDQVIADVSGAIVGRAVTGDRGRAGAALRGMKLRRLPRALDHPEGHPQLRVAVPLGELLHRLPVAVPGEEIHATVSSRRILLQGAIDEADGLEVGAPVERRHEAQAPDHVGNRDLSRRLPLMLGPDDLFGARLLRFEVGVDGAAHRGETRPPFPDPFEKLHDVGRMEVRRQLRQRPVAALVDAVDEAVRGAPGGARLERPGGEAAQILDQTEPEHARPGPELADGERRDGLEAVQESDQVGALELAVAVADELDGERIDARGAAQLAQRELRKLAKVAARQILPDAADLGRDDVVVVEDPLAGLGDELAAMDIVGHQPVGGLEIPGVVVQARIVPLRAPPRRRIDGEAGRQSLGALLELLDARQFVPERPVELRRRAAEDPARELSPGNGQRSASS